jgi:alpha-mannosidase
MSKQKCFLICNAHLDPVWLWPWEEGLAEAISTFRVAADFIDQYPEFVFNHNESLLYEWVERNDPELFKRIQKQVAAGRWHPAGGAYLQPDLIATSGESVIRQFLTGKQYFTKKFGVESRVAHNFDTFGHPQGLIQILAGCGFDAYVFCRPNSRQQDLPIGSFRWRHPSGVEIVARRSDDHYITQGEICKQMLGSAVQGNEGDLETDSREGSFPAHYRDAEGDFMFLWGLGNHGGGATRKEYAQFPAMRADFPNVEFIESTTDAFFAHTLKQRDRDSLPEVKGDFNQIFEGCYTSMLRVKQEHRRMENLMHLTEKLCAMAWWQGRREYPTKDLDVAWKDILFAEFHDILPGSGIPRVEEDSLKMLGHCEEILRRKKAEALIALLRDEPLAERDATPFFIFNPFNWDVTREVVVEYGTATQAGTDSIVRTVFCEGREVDVQFEKGDLNLNNPAWGEWRQKAVFRVTVPAMSYKRFDTRYRVLPDEDVVCWQSPKMPDGERLTIDGEAVSVTINLTSGLIDSIRFGGQEQLKPGSFQPLIFDDIPHSWECPKTWTPSRENFRLATPEEATRLLSSESVNPRYRNLQRPVQIIEDGPVRTIVEAIFVSNHTSLVQRYIINKKSNSSTGAPSLQTGCNLTPPQNGNVTNSQSAVIQLELDVFWAEKDKMLKLGFTPAQTLDQLWAEKCYSIDDETESVSPPERERNFQHFLRRSDGTSSVGVISHGTHGYHQQGNTTWLSVLRSPAYGCMAVAPDWQRYHNRRMPHQDQGERSASFTVVFGEAAATNDSMMRKAYEYNVGLDSLVYFPTKRDAITTKKRSFVATNCDNVILSIMKKSEDGDALILRFWEVAGNDTDFSFTLEGKRYNSEIGAHCLQTLRIRRDGTCEETNLLEV